MRIRRGALRALPAALALTGTVLVVLTGCTATPTVRTSSGPHRIVRGSALSALMRRRGLHGWLIRHEATAAQLSAYADRISALPGQRVRLFVDAPASRYVVHALRIGSYDGGDAIEVWRSRRLPAVQQPVARIEGSTHTPVAPWRPTLTVSTTGWVPGDYLFRLDATAGYQTYVPLTVRERVVPAHAVVLVNGVTTWQAYNDWGGRSLYHGPGGEADFAQRARAVSFDRPYAPGHVDFDFVTNELPAVVLAEHIGLPLDYATDIDVHDNPHLLDHARAVVFFGHDEYWSRQMRAHVTAARDHGVNVAFLGANTMFRRIRLSSTPLGADRLETDYKVAREDPLYGHDNLDITADWREPPAAQPESSLTGSYYECNPAKADLVVNDSRSWLFAGTHASRGLRLHGLVGNEYDRVDPAAPTPRPIDVIFHSPVRCRGVASFADAAYYTVTSGAGVFASGTNSWVCALRNHCGPGRGDIASARFVTAVTTNLLLTFGHGPAGAAHRAVDDLAALHEFAGDPIAAAHRPHSTS